MRTSTACFKNCVKRNFGILFDNIVKPSVKIGRRVVKSFLALGLGSFVTVRTAERNVADPVKRLALCKGFHKIFSGILALAVAENINIIIFFEEREVIGNIVTAENDNAVGEFFFYCFCKQLVIFGAPTVGAESDHKRVVHSRNNAVNILS